MAALRSRCRHYIFVLFLLLSSLFLGFFHHLISAVADWMSTVLLHNTHGVAIVQIQNAGLKSAAYGSLEMQDPKIAEKIAICAPSRNIARLCLHN